MTASPSLPAAGPDFTPYLQLLKIGGIVNVALFVAACVVPMDAMLRIPALVVFTVGAYRSLWPVHYEFQVVFHDTRLSSVFMTRLGATFAEIGYIFLLSQALHRFNLANIAWIEGVVVAMMVQVTLSQGCVWAALLTGYNKLYFYEESGWALMYAANALASVALLANPLTPPVGEGLLWFNIAFALAFLPWQAVNLRAIWLAPDDRVTGRSSLVHQLRDGLSRMLHGRHRRTNADAWGGWIGVMWMMGYFATLIPIWTFYLARTLSK